MAGYVYAVSAQSGGEEDGGSTDDNSELGTGTAADSEEDNPFVLEIDDVEPWCTGIWSGIALTASFLVTWNMVTEFVLSKPHHFCIDGNAAEQHWHHAYRDIFTIVLWSLAWAVLPYAWRSMYIDYRSILGITTRSNSKFLRYSLKLITMVCISHWLFNHTTQCKAPFEKLESTAAYQPLLLVSVLVAYTAYKSGGAVTYAVVTAVLSPFAAAGVTPLDGYVGDVLTSLVKPLQGVAYVACVYGTGEIGGGLAMQGHCSAQTISFFSMESAILLFPNVLRIAQNLRQYADTGHKHPCLTNTGKYLLSLSISLYGLLLRSQGKEFWGLLAAMFASSFYSFLWDLTMDWNLFTSSASFLCVPYRSIHLRCRRLVGGLHWYYAAAAADFVMRFFYIYNFVPRGTLRFGGFLDTCAFFSPEVEVLRRTMWSVFKLEAMHLTQEGG